MKRMFLVSAAALILVVPLAATDGAYAQPNDNDHRQDNDHGRDNDRDNNNRQGNDDGNWDPGRHNGYMWRGHWHFGRPPATVIGHRGYAAGWHQWRRGERLPTDFRTRYVVIDDWRGAHLRPPPRGYHWVRDDRGEYLLVGIATGVILSLILANQ